MRAPRTALIVTATMLLCAAPILARGGGGGDDSRNSDSKSSDNDSNKRSGGGEASNKGGGGAGKGSSGGSDLKSSGDKSQRTGDKVNRDTTGGAKSRASAEDDREWSNGWGRDRNRDGDNGRNRPRCPNGRRNCRDRCCNPDNHGSYPVDWDENGRDGWGFPWPDHPNPGRVDPDDRRIRTLRNNLELKVTPPSAEVFVNGIRYGRKSRITLPSGRWIVEIRAEGYRTETLRLEIKQGDRYRFELNLQPDPDFRAPVREARSDAG